MKRRSFFAVMAGCLASLTCLPGAGESVVFRDVEVLQFDIFKYAWRWVPSVFEELKVGEHFRYTDDPTLIYQVSSLPKPMPPAGNYGLHVSRIWKDGEFPYPSDGGDGDESRGEE